MVLQINDWNKLVSEHFWLRILQSKKADESTINKIISNYFLNLADSSHWTFAVYYLYSGFSDLQENLQVLNDTNLLVFINWFKQFFFDWNLEQFYFLDAMALRIIWEIFGVDIFGILDEFMKKELEIYKEELVVCQKISVYANKVKISFLRSFLFEITENDRIQQFIAEFEIQGMLSINNFKKSSQS